MREVIAYPGVEGSFSWSAAKEMFPSACLAGFESFPQAAEALTRGEADYALLPVENSFAGAVLTTYGLLERMPLFIVGEKYRAVRHQLLGVAGASLAEIRQIDSHPQAIAQCDAFLSTLPGVKIVPSANTAISAREVAESHDPSRAAIASREAAAFYGLSVLKEDIQTSSLNTTRFFLVSLHDLPLGEPDKASVVFTVNNEVGALAWVLTAFAASGLNMTRIESRPIPEKPFLYFFSADFEGAMDRRNIAQALVDARPHTSQLRLLGVYPRGSLG